MFGHHKWCFRKAKWENFAESCIDGLSEIPEETDLGIDEMNHKVCMCIIIAASQSRPILNNESKGES